MTQPPAESTSSAAPENRGPAEREVVVRRAPSVVAFLIAGGVLGVVAALFSTLFGPVDQAYTLGAIFGVMVLIFGTAGAVLGAVLGLLLDWRSRKKVQRFRAVRVEEDAR